MRERLYVEDEAVPALLDRLCAAGLAEAMVLCTCDRVEIWGVGPVPQVGETAFDILAETAGLDRAEAAEVLASGRYAEAVRAVYRGERAKRGCRLAIIGIRGDCESCQGAPSLRVRKAA